MSEHWGVLVGLVAWIAIAVPIVAVGTSPVLAALAASVVGFDIAYYSRLNGRDSVASWG